MFKGSIVSRSNINGKIHSFQKDFDDYDSYQEFIGKNPEYSPNTFLENFWSPMSFWNQLSPLHQDTVQALPTNTKYLPDGVDLGKYESRRIEKRQSEAERLQKKYSLEHSKAYLDDYLAENPNDAEAKDDREKIQKELQGLG